MNIIDENTWITRVNRNRWRISHWIQVKPFVKLVLQISDGNYNRNQLFEFSGISLSTLKRYIDILKTLELVEFIGANKNGYYKATAKLTQLIKG